MAKGRARKRRRGRGSHKPTHRKLKPHAPTQEAADGALYAAHRWANERPDTGPIGVTEIGEGPLDAFTTLLEVGYATWKRQPNGDDQLEITDAGEARAAQLGIATETPALVHRSDVEAQAERADRKVAESEAKLAKLRAGHDEHTAELKKLASQGIEGLGAAYEVYEAIKADKMVIYGDHPNAIHPDTLREVADQCGQLFGEMREYRELIQNDESDTAVRMATDITEHRKATDAYLVDLGGLVTLCDVAHGLQITSALADTAWQKMRQADDPEYSAAVNERVVRAGHLIEITADDHLRVTWEVVNSRQSLTDAYQLVSFATRFEERTGHRPKPMDIDDELNWSRTKTTNAMQELEEMGGDLELASLVEPARGDNPDIFESSDKETLHMSTATLRRFGKLGRDEGVPNALPEEVANRLIGGARHLITKSEVKRDADGHHYVDATVVMSVPDEGAPSAAWLAQLVGKLADKATLDERERSIRDNLITQGLFDADGHLNAEEAEAWIHGEEVRLLRDRRYTKPETIGVGFPIEQYGLYVEGTSTAALEEVGSDAPVHAGSRSFVPIWNRARKILAVNEATDAVYRHARQRVEDERGDFMNTFWNTLDSELLNKVGLAQDALTTMRESRVITVGLDVAEGLPDWESVDECWDYAKHADLPYDIVFLDFATSGGLAPLIEVNSLTVVLRAALVWRNDEGLSCVPFAALQVQGDGQNSSDPEAELQLPTDYDPAGVVHFHAGVPRDEILPMRAEARGTFDGTMVAVPHGSGFGGEVLGKGRPGYTVVPDEASYDSDDGTTIFAQHAMINVAAASRALSILHALESTYNIDLDIAQAPRHERREVQRRTAKGEVAHISQTVRIRATSTRDDTERHNTPRKRVYSHAHWRRGTYAHYPLGTRVADALANAEDPEQRKKLVEHPIKGTCRRIYRRPTIVGRHDEDGNEREPVAKSYVWKSRDPKPPEEAGP